MKEEQKKIINQALKSNALRYVLIGFGAVALIYVSGIVMQVLGKTIHSYNYMN